MGTLFNKLKQWITSFFLALRFWVVSLLRQLCLPFSGGRGMTKKNLLKKLGFSLLLLLPFVVYAAAEELFTTSLYSDTNLSDYWRLEDTSASKGSNTLTNVNSVTFTSGQFGNAATGPFVIASKTALHYSASTTLTDNFTINVWVNIVSNSDSNDNLVFMNGGGGDGYAVGINEPSLDQFDIRWSDNNVFWHVITTDIGTGWHMITFIRDAGTIKAFLDGADLSYTDTASFNTPEGYFSFGNGFWGGGWQYNSRDMSQIDDVSIFNRVLTATEISNLYNGFPAAAASPKEDDSYYEMLQMFVR